MIAEMIAEEIVKFEKSVNAEVEKEKSNEKIQKPLVTMTTANVTDKYKEIDVQGDFPHGQDSGASPIAKLKNLLNVVKSNLVSLEKAANEFVQKKFNEMRLQEKLK